MALSNTKPGSNSNILYPYEFQGVSGPTEKLSAFVDKLLQPIAQQRKSYLKDTTDFINFTERTKVPENAILVSMDATRL